MAQRPACARTKWKVDDPRGLAPFQDNPLGDSKSTSPPVFSCQRGCPFLTQRFWIVVKPSCL